MEEKDLQDIRVETIAFMEQGAHKILAIRCATDEAANKLLKILQGNLFQLNVIVDKDTDRYSITIEFLETDFGIKHDTLFTKDKYPQLSWLSNQQITHITTGYKDENQDFQYLDFHPLENEINLN